MKVLITGITGFVGKYLYDFLIDQEPNIKIFGTYIDEKEHEIQQKLLQQADLLRCDIANFLEVDELIKKNKPDYIYHMAAMSSGDESDRSKVFMVNVDGTVNILKSCHDSGKKLRIILASTSYIYGSSPDCMPFTETDPVNPVGIYAESKLKMERKAKAYLSDNIDLIISRAFNHTGPGQTDNFVVPAFARQIAEIEKGLVKPVLKVGNLEAIRDFSDVRDVVRAYYLLAKKGRTGEIYNIASGNKFSIQKILDSLLSLSKKKIRVEKDPQRMRPSDITCSVGSYQKIKKDLGWQPEIDFKDTIKLTLDYWRSKI